MSAEFLLGLIVGGFLAGAFFFLVGIVIGYQTAFASCVKKGFAVLIKDKLQQAGVGEVVCLEMYVSVISDDDDGDDDDLPCDSPLPYDHRILSN